MVDTTHSIFVRRTDFILSSSAWRIAFCHGWHNSYRLRLPHWSHSAIVCLTYRILSWLAPLLPSSSVALISFCHRLPDVSRSVMVGITHSVFVCRTDLILSWSAWRIALSWLALLIPSSSVALISFCHRLPDLSHCHGCHHSFRLRLSHWSHSVIVCFVSLIPLNFFTCIIFDKYSSHALLHIHLLSA